MIEKAMLIWNALHTPMAAEIFGGLWMISEGLGSSEKIKSNSIYQLIKNGLSAAKQYIFK